MSQTIVTIDVGGTGANTAEGALISLGAAPAISFDQSNTAVVTANIANAQATTANTQANFARAQANAAFNAANNRVLKAGDTMTGNLNVAATLITQNVIPDANVTYDLGTSTARFKDLWLSNSTIYLGEASISAQGGNVSFGNAEIQLSNVTNKLNVTNDLFVSGNVGIGTANPNTKLQIESDGVAGSFVEQFRVRSGPDNNDTGASLGIFQKDNSRGLIIRAGRGSGDQAKADFILNKSGLVIPSATQDTVMTFLQGGNVGIGTSAPSDKLVVNGNITSIGQFASYVANNGGLTVYQGTPGDIVGNLGYSIRTVAGGGWAWRFVDGTASTPINEYLRCDFPSGNLTILGTLTESSSITIKENLDPISDALSSILNLNGYVYDRKDGTAYRRAGLIAEEVNNVLPNLVQKDSDGNPTGIQYTNLIAYLVESIKELKKEIEELKRK
jgi:hypothetical protein